MNNEYAKSAGIALGAVLGADCRQSDYSIAFSSLQSRLDCVHDRISFLSDKLAPVMTQQVPSCQAENEAKNTMASCDFNERMSTLIRTAEVAESRLSDILSRVIL